MPRGRMSNYLIRQGYSLDCRLLMTADEVELHAIHSSGEEGISLPHRILADAAQELVELVREHMGLVKGGADGR